MNECSCLLLSILYMVTIGDSMQEVSQIWAALGSSGAASGDGGGRKQNRFFTLYPFWTRVRVKNYPYPVIYP